MNITEIIRKAGIKSTAQRRAIYKVLMDLGHASADDVASLVRQSEPAITVATVYRVLDSFCEAGLTSRLCTTSGKMHYDITPYDHVHIIDGCGNISDYQDDTINRTLEAYFRGKSVNGKEIKNIKVQLFTE